MTPNEIKALREELKCTAKELAETLGLEQKTVLAWEREELFPTKRWVKAMEVLHQKGPDAIKRKPRGKARKLTGTARLADPKLWEIMRKLLEHPALFDRVAKLAAEYDDVEG